MIRYFIGSSANGEDAAAENVYEYSIRKHGSDEIDITWMRQDTDKSSFWGGWDTRQWPTPFSGFRWAIPEACGFKGRAIYTDVDMINFRDVADLHSLDMGGKAILARKGTRFGGHEFCVMLIDCAAMEQHLMPVSRMKNTPDSHHRYIRMFSGNEQLVGELDPRWNCLDGEDRTIDDMWILHYTKMATQPWKPAWFTGVPEKHPRPELVDLWWNMLEQARNEGYKPRLPNARVDYNIIGR